MSATGTSSKNSIRKVNFTQRRKRGEGAKFSLGFLCVLCLFAALRETHFSAFCENRLCKDPQIQRHLGYFGPTLRARRVMRQQRQFGVTKIADLEVVFDEDRRFRRQAFLAKREQSR